jgi:predicted nucleotidyltransferase
MPITANQHICLRNLRSNLGPTLGDQVNKELSQIGLFTGLLSLLAEASAKSNIVSGYIYGSVLRDDFLPDTSDIDILLVVKDARDRSSALFINALPTDLRLKTDISILTELEVTRRLHPGWSAHYFFNVKSSGICFHGIPLLESIDKNVLSIEEASKRLTHITQRSRFVLANPRKRNEIPFWLAKYQYWVPLCLMELLALYGSAEFRIRRTHEHFQRMFPGILPRLSYPYSSLEVLQEFLEHLSIWTFNACAREQLYESKEPDNLDQDGPTSTASQPAMTN